MEEIISKIFQLLKKNPLELQDEKVLQTQMAALFTKNGISYRREFSLNQRNTIDFMIDDPQLHPGSIGVEVKIKGSKKAIYRQCERYCAFPEISALILVTNKSIGFPESLEQKPCFVANLGVAWL